MGVYARGKKLWLAFTNARGEREWKPTGLDRGQEDLAEQALKMVLEQVAAERRLGDVVKAGPLTVRSYSKAWVKARKERLLAHARSEHGFFEHHINPAIGGVELAELRPRHVRALLAELKTKTSKETGRPLASRTIRSIIGALHCMMREAVVEELVPTNPVQLLRKDLPKKRDRDPLWRAGAIFTRDEIEQLLSDPRIEPHNRAFYALSFLTGMRPGEVCALRWEHYDPRAEPLGQLQVAYAYDTAGSRVKETKTDTPRLVPVHPTLAKVLAEWKLAGWERQYGRRPEPGDLVVPRLTDAREPRNANRQREDELYPDLERLGLRKRRLYDTRRTFVTLAQVDGASKDVLRWISHGPDGDIISVYTTLPWATLCAAVSCLKVELRGGQILELPRAVTSSANLANSLGAGSGDRDSGVTVNRRAQKSPEVRRLRGLGSVGDAGFEGPWTGEQAPPGATEEPPNPLESGLPPQSGLPTADHSSPPPVTSSQEAIRGAVIRAAAEAREDVAGAISGGRLRDLEARGLVVVDLARLLELLGGAGR